jgi:hypothetical protein
MELNSRSNNGVDVMVGGGGTVYTLTPMSTAAHEWIEDNVSDESNWFGGALVVEHRYIRAIVNGMINDGLVVV